MMLGILQTNKDNVLEAISIFRQNLDVIEQAIRSEDTSKLLVCWMGQDENGRDSYKKHEMLITISAWG